MTHRPIATSTLHQLRDLRLPLLAWGLVALVSTFLHGPMPLYSTRTLAVAWEMWQSGDWVVLQFNGEAYSHKTPLVPWLINAGWLVGGVSDLWPRVLMVLLGVVAIMQAAMLASRLYPERPRLPVLAAWAMVGLWYFFLFALQVMYELAMMVAVLGGLLALCRRRGDDWVPWWPGVALAIGLGLLAKGPAALLHLGLPLLAARWWHPQARRAGAAFAGKATLAVLAGIALFALWLVPALVRGDAEYRDALLITQTAGRVHDSFDHAEPWWWYLPVLLMMMTPWWLSRWWWRQLPALWRDPANRFAWLWLVGALVAFSAISGKNQYYLLPEFAAIALLMAVAAETRPRLDASSGVVALLVAGFLLCAPWLAPRTGHAYPEVVMTTLPIAGAVFVVIGLVLLRWRTLPVHAAGVLLAVVVLHAAITPLLWRQFDLTPTARVLGDAQRAGKRVAFLGEYQLQFHYAGRLREPLEVLDEAGARAWSERHPDQLLVVNTLEDWTHPGPQPVIQQRFRSRWIQVWRAGEWRALPAQQLPLQASTRQVRRQPR